MTDPSEHTRQALIRKKMGFNQMRNALYWLQRLFQKNNFSAAEIETHLIKMGENIGATYSQSIAPSILSPKELLQELYSLTVNSKVNVEQISDNAYTVIDKKCALCKYQYEDITVPGCSIEIGMISEMLERSGFHVLSRSVLESKALGHDQCVHEYILENISRSCNP